MGRVWGDNPISKVLDPEFNPLCHLRKLLCWLLVRISLAEVKHHDQNNLGEERVYFTFQHSGQTPSLRAGTQVEAVMGCCLLVCLSWLTQPAFL